jgi:hypothetical protein
MGIGLGSRSGEDAKSLSSLDFWEKSKLETEGNNQELKIFTNNHLSPGHSNTISKMNLKTAYT